MARVPSESREGSRLGRLLRGPDGDQVLYVFVVLAHSRRRIVHFNVTDRPTAQWTAQQVSEAFPWEEAPRYLLRDRDRAYGPAFKERVERMGIEEVLAAPRSPWQNPFVERVIGSIQRECLDHVIVLNERHLRRLLGGYFEHYHRWRCHRSLAMDCPEPRPVHGPDHGRIVQVAEARGLYPITSAALPEAQRDFDRHRS
jgi:putative transposase